MSARILASTVEAVARLLASLGALPGHWGERLVGAYLVGWGATAALAPDMFAAGPTYGTLAAGAEEWVYGAVFVAVGAAQAGWAHERTGHDGRTRRRMWAAVAALASLTGLALAFAHTGAWSGTYTYGCAAAFESVLALRLWFLSYARTSRGLDVRTVHTLHATRSR